MSLSAEQKRTVYGAGGLSFDWAFRTILCLAVLFVKPVDAQSPTNIFSPAATPAHSIFGVAMLVLGVTLFIFLVVAGLLLYALIRYRNRPGDSNREPAQIYGSNQIELSWTVIPMVNRRLKLPRLLLALSSKSDESNNNNKPIDRVG